MAEDGTFRTDDMALAAVLAMSGFSYKLHAMTRDQALWIFKIPAEREEDADTMLDAYADFECKVEPREYIRKVAEIRRELFDLLPDSRKAKPRPVVPSPSPAQS